MGAFTGKKVLVTGSDGFIGSHLTEELVRQGARVRAFVLYNSFGAWGWLDQVAPEIRAELDVFSGDVRDPHGVKTAMAGCDTVFHLAALIGIPYSYHSPDTYLDTNIRGTLNIVQAARELSIARVVHTSTSEVYGTARFVPITEEHPLQGQSPYAATKIGADQLALSFWHAFGTPIAVIRPFNTYGPRQSARAVIPTIITQILSGKKTLRLGATHPTRDFTYVRDTVRGFLAIGASEAAIGRVINIGTGGEISISELTSLIAELIHTEITIEPEAARTRPIGSEVERLRADTTLAHTLLQWHPEYAGSEGLRRGLAETIGWLRNPGNRSFYRSEVYAI